MSFYVSFNCESGNHGGCNEFHLGCVCDHHPLGKHLSPTGRYSFVDVDTYPSATVEELEKRRFYDPQIRRADRILGIGAPTHEDLVNL